MRRARRIPMPRLLVLATLAPTACLLLLGCALKKQPTPQETRDEALSHAEIPPEWAAPSVPGSVADGWLDSFGDARLRALVEEAIAHGADLRIAAARLQQAEAHARIAGAQIYPAVDLMMRGGGKVSDGSGLRGGAVTMSWEIDVWGRVRAQRRAAKTAHEAVASDVEWARESLAGSVARAWFLATEATAEVALARQMLEEQRGLLGLAEDRERVGLGNDYELALSRSRLATHEDAVKAAELARETSLRALEILLGRYPAADVPVPGEMLPMPPDVPAGLPSEILERRPDVVAAERRVAAAFDRVQEAKAARLPRFALTAGGNWITSDLFLLKDRENPSWSVGGGILAPLFHGGALKGQVDVRKGEQAEAVANYADVGVRAFAEVENALSAEFTLREREALLQMAADESERVVELSRVRLRVGSSDMRSVLEDQLGLDASRAALLRVQSERRIQRVNLHLALGGRFDVAPAPVEESAAPPAATPKKPSSTAETKRHRELPR